MDQYLIRVLNSHQGVCARPGCLLCSLERFRGRQLRFPMTKRLLCYSISWICLGGLTARAQVSLNPKPSRELGHPAAAFSALNPIPSSFSPNFVEGRELYLPTLSPNGASGGVALDSTVSPPILYVADTGNSRVLGWNLTDTLGKPGSGPFPMADYVIGQNDRYSTFP